MQLKIIQSTNKKIIVWLKIICVIENNSVLYLIHRYDQIYDQIFGRIPKVATEDTGLQAMKAAIRVGMTRVGFDVEAYLAEQESTSR